MMLKQSGYRLTNRLPYKHYSYKLYSNKLIQKAPQNFKGGT